MAQILHDDGLLFGLINVMDLESTGRIASLCGAIKIEQLGPQNHSFTMDEFKQRFTIPLVCNCITTK